jgi:hypothetical protein
MSGFDRRDRNDRGSTSVEDGVPVLAPGKRTLVEQLTVQRRIRPGGLGPTTEDVQAAAVHGTQGGGGALPHLDAIQRSFGSHDVSHVKAHTDGAAREGATAMGAQAFASGDHVAFAGTPDLHTAAHEAAHVVQQRGGVQLKGGVGEASDAYERHADDVADRVVRGESAEALLSQGAAGASAGASRASPASSGAVQRRLDPDPGDDTRYHYIPDSGASSSGTPTVFTYRGNGQFRSDDGRWWSYLSSQDRFQEIREPHHPAEPQAYASIARSKFSMKNRADEPTPANSLFAAANLEHDRLSQEGAHATGPHDLRSTEFSAERSNPAARRDLGSVAAQSLGETGRVPANELAARQDPAMANDGIHREYLHQQSHGGGGTDTMGNLGIGSAAANTEMIPIEAAVNGRRDLRMRVDFRFVPGTLLLERVDMAILQAGYPAPIFQRSIAGQQRLFTREQYEELQRFVGFATDATLLQEMRRLGLGDEREVIAAYALLEMSRGQGAPGPSGPSQGPSPDPSGPGSSGPGSPMDLS